MRVLKFLMARDFRQQELGDLKSPPGNHLEALKGDQQGRHSIRSTIGTGSHFGSPAAMRMRCGARTII